MTSTPHCALVTGSGRNIGRAIALELARRGMNVMVHGHRDEAAAQAVAEEARAAGVRAEVVMGDLGDRNAVATMADTALTTFGAIDVLVNNAAIRPETPLEELSDDAWHRVFDVNLHSAFALTRAFVPAMRTAGFGRVLYFTGMNAMHGYVARPHVSASKHALWGLTKALAKELGPAGITVNAVSPGPIATEHPDDPEMAHHIQSMLARVPVGRLGLPEEIAALCGFLVSREGGFVSGQMIAANGAAQT
jgi:3-oxoacyl-[acyl-carrier protein] reductase